MWRELPRHGALAVLLALGLGGCSLDELTIPDLEGPSELGLSLGLQANPDVLTADGWSTSALVATLRDPNGQPVAGRDVLFQLSDEDGRFADLGTLETASGARLHAGTATQRTNGQGIAQVIYRSPARTDLTANTSIVVQARPVGTDFNAAVNRTVRIELKSAEPRLFPQNPGNTAPNCNFVVEAPDGLEVGVAILFQSTSNDPDGTIVRYEWDFGDGNRDDAPDTAHIYKIAASYTVTHVVTDDDGRQAACAATLDIS